MTPAHPPLPTAWYLLFQLDAGSHTSILISESLDGLSVAATRQKEGSCLNALFCCAAPRPVAGTENWPAATVSADVMVPFSSESDLRLSQVAPNAVVAIRQSTKAIVA